jgi:hypothetical protein
LHLLFFAHKLEAHAFISCGNIEKIRIGQDLFYKSKDYYLFITNSPVNFPQSDLLALDISKIINLGTAAAIDPTTPVRSIHKIDNFYTQSNLPEQVAPNSLITLRSPYQKESNYNGCLLADMEAYDLWQWSNSKGIEFACYKIVSDSGIFDMQQIKQQAPKMSELLYQYYFATYLSKAPL